MMEATRPETLTLIDQIMALLNTKGTNTSDVPFAFSYERNPDTQIMEWTAYADHKSIRAHYDCMTSGPDLPTVLGKLIHRLKRELI